MVGVAPLAGLGLRRTRKDIRILATPNDCLGGATLELSDNISVVSIVARERAPEYHSNRLLELRLPCGMLHISVQSKTMVHKPSCFKTTLQSFQMA